MCLSFALVSPQETPQGEGPKQEQTKDIQVNCNMDSPTKPLTRAELWRHPEWIAVDGQVYDLVALAK